MQTCNATRTPWLYRARCGYQLLMSVPGSRSRAWVDRYLFAARTSVANERPQWSTRTRKCAQKCAQKPTIVDSHWIPAKGRRVRTVCSRALMYELWNDYTPPSGRNRHCACRLHKMPKSFLFTRYISVVVPKYKSQISRLTVSHVWSQGIYLYLVNCEEHWPEITARQYIAFAHILSINF